MKIITVPVECFLHLKLDGQLFAAKGIYDHFSCSKYISANIYNLINEGRKKGNYSKLWTQIQIH